MFNNYRKKAFALVGAFFYVKAKYYIDNKYGYFIRYFMTFVI